MTVILLLVSLAFKTYLLAFAGLLVSGVLGFFIGRYFSNGSGGDLKQKYETTNLQFIDLEKKFKVEKKQLKFLKEDNIKLKNSNEIAEEAIATLNSEVEELKNQLNTSNDLKEKNRFEYEKISTTFNRLSKDYDELRKSYRADQKDTRAWRAEIEKWNKEAVKYHKYSTKADEKIKDLNLKLQEQDDFQKEIDQLRIDHKSQSHLVKKLNQEVKYWEQQHYNAHHELAALKKEVETHTMKTEEIKLLNNGMKIEKQNLLQMIEEYKTKYIQKNNQYRDLMNKTKVES